MGRIPHHAPPTIITKDNEVEQGNVKKRALTVSPSSVIPGVGTVSLILAQRVLLHGGQPPRVYALAVLACEEVAKLPMLTRAGADTALGRPVNWKRLEERLRSHSEKLASLAMMNVFLGDLPDNPAELRNSHLCRSRWQFRFSHRGGIPRV
jgi:chorismate-pyruvate lyase